MFCRADRIQGLVAAAGLVIVISATVPGRAADAAPKAADTAVTVASAIERPPGVRSKPVAHRPGRGFHTVQGKSDRAGSCCGRPFVLMVGVAY